MKICFKRKISGHRIPVILSTIQFRNFCNPISCLKTKKLEHIKLILPVVLYGCESWFPVLRDEHRLRVFENRVLRRIFGPERDAVT
jgi:hypothetical protein